MKKLLIASLILVSLNGWTQKIDLSSPKATLTTFADNMSDANYKPDIALATISGKHENSRKRRSALIIMLKEYLVKTNQLIDLSGVPSDKDYTDSTHANKSVYYLNEVVYLEKIKKNWYFSKATVNNMPSLYANAGLKGKEHSVSQAKKAAVTKKKVEKVKVDITSPYAALKVFTEYMSDSNYQPDIAASVIYERHIPHATDRVDRIEKLKRFLDGKGVLIDLDIVPDDKDYIDTTRLDEHRYEITYRFSDIYLEKIGRNWYLSEETAQKIPELYDTAFPFGTDRLLKYMPKRGSTKYFGLQVWQYLAILLLVVLIFSIFRFLNWILTVFFTKILFRFGYKDIALTYVNPVARPFGLMIAMVITNIVLPLLQFPIKLASIVNVSVASLIPLFATIASFRAMDIVALYFKKLSAKTESTLDDQLVPLFRKALKTFVVIIGAFYVLQNLSIDIVPLLGVLSIGGLAFALAAQDTIKNFFGSLMIFIDKPFQAGQWISSGDGIDGTVEEVGIRSTRIRTFSNSVIYVPNGKLADATIDNHGLRVYRRFTTTIQINYDTPPDIVELFVDGLRKMVNNHPHTRKDSYHIYMNNLGDHAFEIMFYIFFKAPSWGLELQYRHEIIMDIIKLAHTLGVQFAFPTQTVNVENLPGQLSLSATYETEAILKPKMDNYFNRTKPKKG